MNLTPEQAAAVERQAAGFRCTWSVDALYLLQETLTLAQLANSGVAWPEEFALLQLAIICALKLR